MPRTFFSPPSAKRREGVYLRIRLTATLRRRPRSPFTVARAALDAAGTPWARASEGGENGDRRSGSGKSADYDGFA